MSHKTNVYPFRPAQTGLRDTKQTTLFSESEYIKLAPPMLTRPEQFPSDESCEGITLALMMLGNEVSQEQMWADYGCSRLSAYIHELRKMGIAFIVDEQCLSRRFRPWDKAEMSESDGNQSPPKGYVKRFKKYFLPEAFRKSLPPEAMKWASGTFLKWRGFLRSDRPEREGT